MGNEHYPYDISFEETFHLLNRHYDLIPCNRCQLCVCHYRHEIHSVVRYFNYARLGKEEWAKDNLRRYIFKMNDHCKICNEKTCLSSCPHNLPINDLVRMIHEYVAGASDRSIMEKERYNHF